jgi:hypothetical protein
LLVIGVDSLNFRRPDCPEDENDEELRYVYF